MVEWGHTDVFGPSFLGAGKRPDLIPAYQLDRLIPSLSRTSGNRIKRSPVVALLFFMSISIKAHDYVRSGYFTLDRVKQKLA